MCSAEKHLDALHSNLTLTIHLEKQAGFPKLGDFLRHIGRGNTCPGIIENIKHLHQFVLSSEEMLSVPPKGKGRLLA